MPDLWQRQQQSAPERQRGTDDQARLTQAVKPAHLALGRDQFRRQRIGPRKMARLRAIHAQLRHPLQIVYHLFAQGRAQIHDALPGHTALRVEPQRQHDSGQQQESQGDQRYRQAGAGQCDAYREHRQHRGGDRHEDAQIDMIQAVDISLDAAHQIAAAMRLQSSGRQRLQL